MVKSFSNNALGRDNQQERLKTIGWIVGFTDGEGTFSVSLIKNNTTKIGWQVFPEFVITQGEKNRVTLENVKEFFKCGNIFINRRQDNHKEPLYRYCVRSIKNLTEIIVPFFSENILRTAKHNDFRLFSEIIEMINKKMHLDLKGIIKIAKIIEKMNRKVPSRFLESSETIRVNRQRDDKI